MQLSGTDTNLGERQPYLGYALTSPTADVSLIVCSAGISVDSNGDWEVKASSPLYQSIEKSLDEQVGTIEDVVTLPFERARVKLWTVATAAEAERLLEPFLALTEERAGAESPASFPLTRSHR